MTNLSATGRGIFALISLASVRDVITGKNKTKHEMKTDNELIAEFMGGVFHRLDDGFGKINERWFFVYHPNPHCNASTYKSREDLEYHLRWDWLMPVVEKIEVLQIDSYQFRVRIIKNFCAIESFVRFTGKPDVNFSNEEKTKIEYVYKTVVEFIKWYSTHSTETK